jgi:hypothetical protein
MPGSSDRACRRWRALRLLLRRLYRALVRLSAVLLSVPDGLPVWPRSGISLPLSSRVGAKPGAGLRPGTFARQCADPAGAAAATVLIRRAHPKTRAASERNADMILSASLSAPGSWVRR